MPGSTKVAAATVNFRTRSQRVRRSMYDDRGMWEVGWVARLLGWGDKSP